MSKLYVSSKVYNILQSIVKIEISRVNFLGNAISISEVSKSFGTSEKNYIDIIDGKLKLGKNEIKAGKMIKSIFPDLTDLEIKYISEDFIRKAFLKWQVLPVQYIPTVYNLSYSPQSCMHEKGELYNFLLDYFPSTRILVFADEDLNKVFVRALIWNAVDEDDNEYIVLDKVYPENRAYEAWMQFKKIFSISNKKLLIRDITYSIELKTIDWEKFDKKLIVCPINAFSVDDVLYDGVEFPYMDTFQFIDKFGGLLSKRDEDTIGMLVETDGTVKKLKTYCEICSGLFDIEDMETVYTEYRDEYKVCCDCVEAGEDVVYSSWQNEYIFKDEAVEVCTVNGIDFVHQRTVDLFSKGSCPECKLLFFESAAVAHNFECPRCGHDLAG